MDRSLPVLPGRGATANPANRFERLHVEDVPDVDDEEGRPRTLTKYYRDHSRGVLTRNDSPDVGFEWSVNPYRGCEHGCAYCLAPDTPVLHADLTERPIADVQIGDVVLGFDEHCEPGRQRKLRPAAVEAKWRSRRPTLRIVTPRGEVVTTGAHQWLVQGSRWVETARLEAAQALLRLRTVRLGRNGGDLGVATTPEPILAVERRPTAAGPPLPRVGPPGGRGPGGPRRAALTSGATPARPGRDDRVGPSPQAAATAATISATSRAETT